VFFKRSKSYIDCKSHSALIVVWFGCGREAQRETIIGHGVIFKAPKSYNNCKTHLALIVLWLGWGERHNVNL